MKKLIFFILLQLFFISSYAQTDTIYSNNEKISCTVKEVAQDAVKYSYPGEDLINTIYKNTIQKIVFKSGRVQTFAEATSYKTVSGADDFENVTLTSVEGEVKGLFKLGDVSSKAKGTTTLASMEKVKERAIKKMKIEAAMMGANIVYLTQNSTTGNQMGTRYQAGHSTETNLAGVAYSNKLPSFDNFQRKIGSKKTFQCFEVIKMSQREADMDRNQSSKNVVITNIYNESGLIMIKATIDGVDNDTFRIISYDNNEFTISYKDGERIFNYRTRF